MARQPKCEGCGEPADGEDLMGTPLCRSCGVMSELNQSEEEEEFVKKVMQDEEEGN